jgi:hypothetical protein
MLVRILDRMMNEVAVYGGLPLRRCDILRLATEHLGKDAGEPFGAQYFAFHPPAVELEPWPLEEARRIMAP